MAREESAWQTTIARPVSFEGCGLHKGTHSRIRILPAPAGTGVAFTKMDLADPITIPASTDYIGGSQRATDLCRDGVTLHTVEHILAAVVWSGVDNAVIEVRGEEIPLGDGSALSFVELVEEAGLRQLGSERAVNRVLRPLRVTRAQAHIVALPYEGLRVTLTFVGRKPGPTSEHVDFEVVPDTFRKEIAPARTIGFDWEMGSLHARGLALGASPEQAVIIGDGGYVGSSRYPDEAARHKVLDLLGDIALAGRALGHFIAIGSGHSLNHELAKMLARQSTTKREELEVRHD